MPLRNRKPKNRISRFVLFAYAAVLFANIQHYHHIGTPFPGDAGIDNTSAAHHFGMSHTTEFCYIQNAYSEITSGFSVPSAVIPSNNGKEDLRSQTNEKFFNAPVTGLSSLRAPPVKFL